MIYKWFLVSGYIENYLWRVSQNFIKICVHSGLWEEVENVFNEDCILKS